MVGAGAVAVLGLAAAGWAIGRAKADTLAKALGVGVAAMVLMSGARLGLGLAALGSEAEASPAEATLPGLPPIPATTRPSERPPDVFYVVLDGYARHDVLREHFGHGEGDADR